MLIWKYDSEFGPGGAMPDVRFPPIADIPDAGHVPAIRVARSTVARAEEEG